MRYLFFGFFSLILFSSCHKKLISTSWSIEDKHFTNITETERRARSNCNDPASYIPDTMYADHFYMRTVRVNFHLIDDTVGGNNFPDGQAQDFLTQVMNDANGKMAYKAKMNLPIGNNTAVIDPHLRWKLSPSKDREDEKGYYFQKENSIDAFFINHGRGQNNYKRAVIDRNVIDDDSILNIFIMSYPPDSLGSPTFKTPSSGIALGNSIKIGGLYQKGKEAWYYGGLLNHEIGHVFSLAHAWVDDGCDDTPKNPNCYNYTDSPPCDKEVSNNMMDYNVSQIAITPCQIGKMHMVIARENSKQRGLVVPDWCKHDTSHVIQIYDQIEWLGARDMSNSIVIKSGASLKLCCRVSMPINSSITIEPGGKLILEDVKLHNDCGHTWKGIIAQELGNQKAEIEIHGSIELQNVE